MKTIVLIALSVLVLCGAGLYVLLSPAEVYGEPFKIRSLTSLREIVGQPDRYLTADLRTSGRIVRQCPSSGCWFFLDDGSGGQVRVELGHLGMKFPQHVGGTAIVEGRLMKDASGLELVGNGVRFER
ncbi:MAG TPA: hypothetical protein PLP29_03525 [Candidatus Ozemobacteraceae bacterium]|nr:hypothetical protein [Candidatus Ozemobacteraceae bacterium]